MAVTPSFALVDQIKLDFYHLYYKQIPTCYKAPLKKKYYIYYSLLQYDKLNGGMCLQHLAHLSGNAVDFRLTARHKFLKR